MVKVTSVINQALDTEALVVGIFKGQSAPKELDELTYGEIAEDFKTKKFKPELKKLSVYATKQHKKILLVGLGKKEELDLEKIRACAAESSTYLRDKGIKTFTIELFEFKNAYEAAYATNEGVQLSLYNYTKYKTKNADEIKKIDECKIKCDKELQHSVDQAIRRSNVVVSSVFIARDLQNEPSCNKNPEMFANVIKKVAKDSKLSCQILDVKDMKKLGMNLILAVNSGSAYPAKFAILKHKAKSKDTVVLVGKGITFDSGGIQVKPEAGMDDMKFDMSGAAVVLGTLRATSLLKLPVNVVGLMPLTDNMPSGSCYKPGDVYKSMNGKNVEIMHTDAEGRLVLADALAYAEKFKPNVVVDLATLTGACIVALGSEYAGLLSKDEKLSKKLRKSGNKMYERLWQLPMPDEYKEEMKSNVADIKNISTNRREAGAIIGGIFLQEFIKSPWAHLDIAGTAHIAKDKPYKPKGGTGFGVRLLVDFLENW